MVDVMKIGVDFSQEEMEGLEQAMRDQVLADIRAASFTPAMRKAAVALSSGTTARGGLIIQPDRLLDLAAALAGLAVEDRAK